MKKMFCFLVWLCAIPAVFSLAAAHEAHEHGAAKMNIAVDGAQVSISLESPLVNFLPFEHIPATWEQRKQVKDMSGRMHRAEELFRLSPAAECRLREVSLESEKLDAALLDPAIPLDPAKSESGREQNMQEQSGEETKTGKEEHGDLDADFVFQCAKPEKLNSVDILLFTAWPGLEKIAVQAITPKGQRAARLTAKKHLVSW